MDRNIQKRIAFFSFRRRQKRFWKKVLTVMAAIVVFCTTYALILPAITQDTHSTPDKTTHTHDDSCYTQICICGFPEEPHTHSETCYETRLVEAQVRRHLICQEADQPHIHHDLCYEASEGEEPLLICGLTTEPHHHAESCFTEEYIEAYEEQVLICELPETNHIHNDSCFEQKLTCSYANTDATTEPVSNTAADTETMLDWQEMFADYPYTGNLRKDLVGLAKTQVGYCESAENFVIGYDGIRHGYTRYGARFDAPYKEWSSLFVSFCLHYAGADPEELPGETETEAMMKLWEEHGRYIPADTYIPFAGDLVFFEDNTVGIVTEVQASNFYVICGDVEDSVQSRDLLLTDETIIGWGSTEGASSLKEVLIPNQTTTDGVDILDISNGPAFFIICGDDTLLQVPQLQTFSLRKARAITDLIPYLEANGGSYFFTLLNFNNEELPKDDQGNYVVQADKDYKLTLSFVSPHGFLPGTYQYQIPNGLLVDGGQGTFILKDGTNVGDWVVTDEGLITLYFNDQMNSRTDITISSTLGIHFPQQDDPIDFDGKVTVTVEKPNQDLPLANMLKWGSQGDEANGQDPTKIYWTALITGNTGTQVPGNTITDRVLVDQYLGEHHYTQSDMAAGLSIGISDPNGNWHSWVVYPGDPNLIWEEETWSYTMPEVGNCMWCGALPLGNEGFEYYIQYTSTPKMSTISGARDYMNHVTVDNVSADGWAKFTQGEIHADITKTGTFMGDASGGAFVWEFQALIPGLREGQKADYFWYIMDLMSIRSPEGNWIAYITNDSNQSTVTANYNGATIVVPRVEEATDADPYAWHNYWSPDQNGIYYGRQLILLNRCHCTEDTCQFWSNGRCNSDFWFVSEAEGWHPSGFCHCWTAQENTLFTFTYKTQDLTAVEAYGGMNNSVRNDAELYNMIVTPDGTIGTKIDTATDSVPIPELFDKVLTQDFDGYTANYKITINESKLVLTDGSPLTIHDMMTETLAFVSGSLVITAEDAQGNKTTLRQGVDYTTYYDGTGAETDEAGKPVHVLEIVILHPQPVTYVLDYDATLIIPPGTTQAIKYNNSAKITLWGEEIKESSTEKVYADINIAAKSYTVDLFKTSASTGEPLGGATFGLFNEQGGLITSDVTDANGKLTFQTNIVNGIILRDHILYYMQELKAPAGYRLDDTIFWFCFCDNEKLYCKTCEEVTEDKNALRIPFEQVGKVNATNELMQYALPATGGPGTKPYIAGGTALFIAAAIGLLYKILRRKEDEDDSP